MIHDASVEVTCDGPNCVESVFVELEWVYSTWSGKSGHYDSNDGTIEAAIQSRHDWIVRDRKHFCSSECAGDSP